MYFFGLVQVLRGPWDYPIYMGHDDVRRILPTQILEDKKEVIVLVKKEVMAVVETNLIGFIIGDELQSRLLWVNESCKLISV